MMPFTDPDTMWNHGSGKLGRRLLPALKRYVVKQTFGADDDSRLSRAAGGRG